MRLAVVAALSCLIGATPCMAEVAVERDAAGVAVPVFEPGPAGPWDRVSQRPVADVLNEQGDALGDGWPSVTTNAATGRPEVAWASGGSDSEILFSAFGGDAWLPPVNVSTDGGANTTPVLTSDFAGNRFIAWAHGQGMQLHAVFVTCLSGDGTCQTRKAELSRRIADDRRPSVAVGQDGLTWVAYEEHLGTEQVTHVVLDRVTVGRDTGGLLSCGGEDTIDIARQFTRCTHHGVARAAAEVRVSAEEDEVWVTWIDGPGSLGYVQREGGVFTAPRYVTFVPSEGDEGARHVVRNEVLAD